MEEGFEEVQRTIIDLVVELKINEIQNRISEEGGNKGFSHTKREKYQDRLYNIFKKSAKKTQETHKTGSLIYQITFKMISNQKGVVAAAETWEIECVNLANFTEKKSMGTSETGWTLEDTELCVRSIVSISDSLPKWGNFLNSHPQKSSKFSITYQVTALPKPRPITHATDKKQTVTSHGNVEVHCKVYFSFPQLSLISQHDKTAQQQHFRKESTSTLDSFSQLPGDKTRKISIYSLYDQETDITILSSGSLKLSSHHHLQTLEIQFRPQNEDHDESSDQFEQIPSPCTISVSSFKQSLSHFQFHTPNLQLQIV